MTYATILVNMVAGTENTHLLDVAIDVAERFQAGVIGSTACAPVQLVYGDGNGYGYGDIMEQDSQQIESDTEAAEAEFRAAMGQRVQVLGWRSAVLVTSLSDHLAREARRADLILTSASSGAPFNASRQIDLGDLVMQAGRPVLVVAPAKPGTTMFEMDRALVAWKDTREARRATADALPLLKRASHVSLVEIAPEDDLDAARSRLDDVAGWLGRHGVTASAHAIASAGPEGGDHAITLAAAVAEHDADIIVAGAYGHNRVREWAFGGVTRTLLRHPTRTSFLSH